MKRDLFLLEMDEISHKYHFCKIISCEVTGEMCDGRKVWTDTKTGNQYFCVRLYGKYFFIEM